MDLGSKTQAGPDILTLEVGEILQNLGFADARREHLEYIRNLNSHSPNARTPPTLQRVIGDALEQSLSLGHGGILAQVS